MRAFVLAMLKRIVCTKFINGLVIRVAKQPFFPGNWAHHIPFVGRHTIHVRQVPITLQSDGNDSIVTALHWGGLQSYEANTIDIFMELVEGTRTVFDVGANTGIYALLAAKGDVSRKVHAFEPVPRIFQYLQDNVALNGLSGNLNVEPLALTNYDGEIPLYIPKGTIPTTASTRKGFRVAAETLSVRALTLDTYAKLRQVTHIDLLKIDTESTEHLVLDGARGILARDEPIIICEVLKDRTEKALHQILDGLGYRYFWITQTGLIEKEQIEGDGSYQNLDYVFLTERRIRELSSGLETTFLPKRKVLGVA